MVLLDAVNRKTPVIDEGRGNDGNRTKQSMDKDVPICQNVHWRGV